MDIVRRASALALADFRPGAPTSAATTFKAGDSPVTDADRRVDAYLKTHLAALDRAAGWLSEETADTPERLTCARVFIVDPIDGTRAFMSGDPRWGVSVALVEDGRPVMGVLHMPALDAMYLAERGAGALLNGAPMRVSGRSALAGARIAGPGGLVKSLARLEPALRIEPRIPSLAYRLTRVADGGLDAAVASDKAYDWDIAAADLLIHEAGGQLTGLDGRPPLYNQVDTRHPPLCAAPRSLGAELLAAMRRATV